MIAADLMSENPRTLRVDETVSDARVALDAMDVRHLPIVNDDGDLVGIVSDRDLGALGRDPTAATSFTPVAEIMSSNPVSVTPDADVSEIVELMLENRIGAVPVIDADAQVVGIVTYVDLLRAWPTATEEVTRAPTRQARRARKASHS